VTPSPRVDLHLHTTASDGRCTPAELVDRAIAARLTVIAVTDHDTTAGVAETQAIGHRHGLEVIAGIEITSMDGGRDTHILGYFYDIEDAELLNFLATQRRARVDRVAAIGERLAALGVPIDTRPLLEQAARDTGRSIGRPQIARAMIAAGHVSGTSEAFDRWLGHGCPGFVPRSGPTPEEAIAMLHRAGGLVSIAHPGADDLADRIPSLAAAGLDAIEAFHSDHDAAMVEQYSVLARRLNLLVTGGSDFHGSPEHGLEPGSVTLPADDWDCLRKASTKHRVGR
jgi:3',5'-nucleoside bisphosphate phosphatase